MFKDFLSALVLEILRSFKKEGGFAGPKIYKDYLDGVSEEDLMSDLRLVFQVINGMDLNSLNLKGSAFFKSTLRFFAEDFASKLDALGGSFYLLPYEERKKKAEQLIEGDSHTVAALRDLLVTNSYQEITEAIEQLSKSVADAGTIVVQTPRDIDPELKKEMRAKLAADFPLTFPAFQINRQLIGGFRVFVNGKSHDLSWFSQVQKLTSLKS
ncbi:MAG: F0F1 ATP synthase subunit delta [Candidatus Gracilibacteria bacterium]|jgi:F0F1-type ATP synthase delta subunit